MVAIRFKPDMARKAQFSRYCEGFRMPAHDGGATHTGAGVRSPNGGNRGRWGEMARQILMGI